jgi:hypothetical protein
MAQLFRFRPGREAEVTLRHIEVEADLQAMTDIHP